MNAAPTGAKPYYFVPQPSYWPLVGSLALLLLGMGAALWMNSVAAGPWMVLAGFAVLLTMMFGWFGTVIGESEQRLYNKKVDMSFRWSMGWFIFSEVMFFGAFFGALFYVRTQSVPDLGSPTSKLFAVARLRRVMADARPLWQGAVHADGRDRDSAAQYDHPAHVRIHADARASRPQDRTIARSSSSGCLRRSCWASRSSDSRRTSTSMRTRAQLKLSTGVYGSTFFMLTGFHGFHVTVGAIMLSVMLGRAIAGHFDRQHHFAFEAAAWYWHFVDVVWLLLFVLFYWL
jgi:cytochrome c oxidase subunit 3